VQNQRGIEASRDHRRLAFGVDLTDDHPALGITEGEFISDADVATRTALSRGRQGGRTVPDGGAPVRSCRTMIRTCEGAVYRDGASAGRRLTIASSRHTPRRPAAFNRPSLEQIVIRVSDARMAQTAERVRSPPRAHQIGAGEADDFACASRG
jgi:hypothetical protein